MTNGLAKLGGAIVGAVASFGDFIHFSAQALEGFALSLVNPRTWRLLPAQFLTIGVLSVPVVLITGLFVGMVLGVQTYAQFAQLGLASQLGAMINSSVVRELGPVLAATMLAGRVGGAVTAELGTMRVTEQIDALRVMGADPIRYLTVPRFWACFVMIPLLTAYTDIAGVIGGYLVVVGIYKVGPEDYIHFGLTGTEVFDMATGLVKSCFFGATIGLVSCYKGFNCKPGAAGVGRACTEGFVLSFVAILAEDFFLAVFFKELYEGIWGVKIVL